MEVLPESVPDIITIIDDDETEEQGRAQSTIISHPSSPPHLSCVKIWLFVKRQQQTASSTVFWNHTSHKVCRSKTMKNRNRATAHNNNTGNRGHILLLLLKGGGWRDAWMHIRLWIKWALDQNPLRIYTHFTLPILTWITVRNMQQTRRLGQRTQLAITAL